MYSSYNQQQQHEKEQHCQPEEEEWARKAKKEQEVFGKKRNVDGEVFDDLDDDHGDAADADVQMEWVQEINEQKVEEEEEWHEVLQVQHSTMHFDEEEDDDRVGGGGGSFHALNQVECPPPSPFASCSTPFPAHHHQLNEHDGICPWTSQSAEMHLSSENDNSDNDGGGCRAEGMPVTRVVHHPILRPTTINGTGHGEEEKEWQQQPLPECTSNAAGPLTVQLNFLRPKEEEEEDNQQKQQFSRGLVEDQKELTYFDAMPAASASVVLCASPASAAASNGSAANGNTSLLAFDSKLGECQWLATQAEQMPASHGGGQCQCPSKVWPTVSVPEATTTAVPKARRLNGRQRALLLFAATLLFLLFSGIIIVLILYWFNPTL